MPRPWRLLLDPPADGVWNMAVDEALLASAQADGPPTLRLYAWRGPWLSLGYAQTLSRIRAEACGRAGVGIVKRVTGGRAVLHGADLTYAVAAPEAALPPGLRESYALVSRALMRALTLLAVEVERAPRARGARQADPATDFDCFARAAEDEICAGGRKLAGSAQRRAGAAALQHGSLRLVADPPFAARAAGLVPDAATSLGELGLATANAVVREAVVAAFARELGAALEPGALSAEERTLAMQRALARGEKPWEPPDPVGPLPSSAPPAGR